MARPIVLSNGELHVGLNKYGLVHDFYYPYVGLENHVAGQLLRHKVGIWVDGSLSWLDEDPDWNVAFRYPHEALVGHILARNDRIGVVLEFDDFVDATECAFIRKVHIINKRDDQREIRLFMHQAFAIGDSRSNTDTAQYLPQNNAILHYRGRRAFIISGLHDNESKPFDQYTVGLFGIEGHEGSHRDADDGELSFCNVEHGRVDSVLRFSTNIQPHSSARINYWIAAGTSMREALHVHKHIKEEGAIRRLHKTEDWWHRWLEPAQKIVSELPKEYRSLFIKSATTIKSHADKRGAIMASTDTTMLNYARDTYAYSWPRDGAYIVWPLARIGYKDEVERFFKFCQEGLHNDGYLMHKYRADGALGSSWHPYTHKGVYARPIQEDETAIVLYVFNQYYQMHKDGKLLDDFYETMIVPMANFMADFIDNDTGLPKPSYDLWEEVLLTTTYTTAVVYGALVAAADLAKAAEDDDRAAKWLSVAQGIYGAARKHLYNSERRAFYKGIMHKDGQITKDETIDVSSFFGAFTFGLFDLDDEELKNSYQTIIETFKLEGENIGLPRYENDNYYRTDEHSLPNKWFITTLWLAQYYIQTGAKERAEEILSWVHQQASTTGMLSEQVHPDTSEHLSVEPLAWSHAEYMSTILDLASSRKK